MALNLYTQGPVSMTEIYGTIFHGRLPKGRWWACQYPERPVTDDTEYQFMCVKCFPAFEMAYEGGLSFRDYANGGIAFEVPAAHGDRWNWYMDESLWLVGEAV